MASYSLPNIVAQSGTYKITLYSDDAGLTAPTAQTVISIGRRAERVDTQVGRVELSTLEMDILEDYTTYTTDGFWATWMATVYNSKSPQVKITLNDDGTDREFFWGVVDKATTKFSEVYRDGDAHIRRISLTLVDVLSLLAETDIFAFVDMVRANDTQYDGWTALVGNGPPNPTDASYYFLKLGDVLRAAVATGLGQAFADTTLTFQSCDMSFTEKYTGEAVTWDNLYVATTTGGVDDAYFDYTKFTKADTWVGYGLNNTFYVAWPKGNTYPPVKAWEWQNNEYREFSKGTGKDLLPGQWYYDTVGEDLYVNPYEADNPSSDLGSGGFNVYGCTQMNLPGKYSSLLDVVGDILRQFALVMRRTHDGTNHVVEILARKRSFSTETLMDGAMTTSDYIPNGEEAISSSIARFEYITTFKAWAQKNYKDRLGNLSIKNIDPPQGLVIDVECNTLFYAPYSAPDDQVSDYAALWTVRAIEADYDNDSGTPMTTETSAIPIYGVKWYNYAMGEDALTDSLTATAGFYVNAFVESDSYEREYASLKGDIDGTTTFYNVRPGMMGVIDGVTYYARSVELDPMTDSARVKWIS